MILGQAPGGNLLIASGLSLTFGVMGVLNFAHGGLCMLGAYFGYTLVQVTGSFWLAMITARPPVPPWVGKRGTTSTPGNTGIL